MIWLPAFFPHVAGVVVTVKMAKSYPQYQVGTYISLSIFSTPCSYLTSIIFCSFAYFKFLCLQWALALGGLVLEGVSCFLIPFSGNFFVLMLPICVICFGIALIDTALLPMLGFIVDKKYTAVYGSVYAIADISYCAGA